MERKNSELIAGVYKKDARELNEIVDNKIVDVTITSPPYYNLKDYGYKKQIGYGQSYDDYLSDLKIVFKNVFDCTKETGTLWVIIDSFRSNNEVIPLPFDFSNTVKEVGWKLQEVIIWAKDRTVPWAHKGQMRNLFEYILLFSKSDKYNFYVDEVRDFEVLKRWWVKYPERYNPKGKTPSGIWHFDIPTQGSWGDGYIKHFCPLPEEMIAQILKLTTKEGDLVLDPFAGSGAVLAKADNMNRNYVGFELNSGYIKMFNEYLKKTGKEKKERYLLTKKMSLPQSRFESLILDLRVLKFCRVLYSKLSQKDQRAIIMIFVERTKEKSVIKNVRCTAEYLILVNKNINVDKLTAEIRKVISKPPLSKFGIEAKFYFEQDTSIFVSKLNSSKVYTYTRNVTHKYKNIFSVEQLLNTAEKSDIILSRIKVKLNEKDYE
jgi:DNA modification methylase